MLGKESGFNGARLHQKVFEERYYYWADKLGYLTWGESASWVMNTDNELAVRNFISEWSEVVIRDRIALFILTLILCKVIFTGSGVGTPSDDSMTFGAAVELAVAMPLSWLPLISDYTREAKEPVKATAVSAVTYGIVSCWMYVIGMGAAIITGEYDIAQIMLKAGLGILGLLIIVFSTVTTTFLDAYSAGISSETVVSRWNGKHVAIVVTVIGTAAAIVYPMDNITDFLYLIGSVFAPMIAIQIADFFLLKQDKSSRAVYVPNMIIWVIGFVVYRILMNVDMPVGNTLPDMVITIILCLIAGKLIPEKNQKK